PPPLPALRLLPSPPHPPDLPSFPTRRSSDLPRRSTRWRTSTLTTAGPTFSATAVTTREYASSSSPSDAAAGRAAESAAPVQASEDRKSTRLNSSHVSISYAVFCLKKKRATSQ